MSKMHETCLIIIHDPIKNRGNLYNNSFLNEKVKVHVGVFIFTINNTNQLNPVPIFRCL